MGSKGKTPPRFTAALTALVLVLLALLGGVRATYWETVYADADGDGIDESISYVIDEMGFHEFVGAHGMEKRAHIGIENIRETIYKGQTRILDTGYWTHRVGGEHVDELYNRNETYYENGHVVTKWESDHAILKRIGNSTDERCIVRYQIWVRNGGQFSRDPTAEMAMVVVWNDGMNTVSSALTYVEEKIDYYKTLGIGHLGAGPSDMTFAIEYAFDDYVKKIDNYTVIGWDGYDSKWPDSPGIFGMLHLPEPTNLSTEFSHEPCVERTSVTWDIAVARVPVADAGLDQTVYEGDTVQFDGSNSHDPEAWVVETVDSAPDVGYHTSISLDSDDNPRISYFDSTNHDLRYAKWLGSSWAIETVDSGYVAGYTSLALDSDDNPHISYFDLAPMSDGDLKYAFWNGNAWNVEAADPSVDAGYYTSIALDSDDNPHISYWDFGNHELRYAKRIGGKWFIVTVDSVLLDGGYNTVALDSDDNPHISYSDKTNGDLKYAFWNGSVWSLNTVDSEGDVGDWASIALDSDDNPHIGYFDKTNGDLKYAFWNGSAWSIETVNLRDGVGGWISLALDTDDNPHVSYFSSFSLRYASWNGTTWNAEIADSGYAGWWSSISVDSNDNPHVSYTQSNGSLGYAKKAGGIVSYEWDFDADVDSDGDGNFTNDVDATGPTPTHVYYDDGVYVVTLKVRDDAMLSDWDTCSITVMNVPPTAEWTSRSLDGTILNPPYPEGKEILFEATVYDPGIYDTFTYDWDFGDGTILLDAGPSVTHTYGDNDTYIVVLKVTDDDGGIGIDDTPPLLTTNEDPVASISLPRCPFFEGAPTCPIDGSFTDPGWLDTHSAVWIFGDGEYEIAVIAEENEPPDATGMNRTSHVYGDNGVYNITFTVVDDDGGTDTALAWASPYNLPPSITVAIPSSVNEGEWFDLGMTATDPGSDDLFIEIDWGDGTSETETFYNNGFGPDPPNSGPGVFPFTIYANVSHVYGDDGDFTVTVEVGDDDGGKTTNITTIKVDNVAPAIAPFGSFTLDEGSPLDLSATSTDQGSDDLIFTWEFELGPTIANTYYNDGIGPDPYPSPGGSYPFTATDTVQHTYGDNGVFNVTLTVDDDDGGATTYTTTITVDNVAPTITDIKAYIPVNFTLRITGEKWHNVEIIIYEDGTRIGYAEVTRYPGNPDEQAVSTGYVKCDITKTITALLLYTPEDDPINGQINGANPVWLTLTFDDGSEVRLKHTFNVQHPETWAWKVVVNPYMVGHEITFEAYATDPGSDDLTFTWNWGDGSLGNETTYYNDGMGPDPYPSPGGTYPFSATDMKKHTFTASEVNTVTLTVEDDDGGIGVAVITMFIP